MGLEWTVGMYGFIDRTNEDLGEGDTGEEGWFFTKWIKGNHLSLSLKKPVPGFKVLKEVKLS